MVFIRESTLEVGSDVSAGGRTQFQRVRSVAVMTVGLFGVREGLTVLYPGEHQSGGHAKVGSHVRVRGGAGDHHVDAGWPVSGAPYPLEVTTPAASHRGQVTTTGGVLVVTVATIADTVAHGVVRDTFGYFVGGLQTLVLLLSATVSCTRERGRLVEYYVNSMCTLWGTYMFYIYNYLIKVKLTYVLYKFWLYKLVI